MNDAENWDSDAVVVKRKLPREIIQAIIDYLADDTAALRRLSQANRRFRNMIAPTLYGELDVFDMVQGDAIKAARLAEALPGICQWTHVLRMKLPIPDENADEHFTLCERTRDEWA